MFKSFLRFKSVFGPIIVIFVALFVVGCSKKIAPVGGSTGLSNDESASGSTKTPTETASSKKALPGRESENARPLNGGVTDESLSKRTPSEDGTSTESPSGKNGTGKTTSPEDLVSNSSRQPGSSNIPGNGQAGNASGSVLSNNGPSFMKNVYFDYDKAIVRSDTKATLEENSRWLALNSNIKIQIEGHGDERGTNNYNLALGERRARSIMRYLINLGISKTRFSFISYGEERSVCSDQDEDCYQKNRRVHFLVRG